MVVLVDSSPHSLCQRITILSVKFENLCVLRNYLHSMARHTGVRILPMMFSLLEEHMQPCALALLTYRRISV